MNFNEWLESTQALQIQAYGTDPAKLEGEDLAEYVRWNVLAATDELHELLGEIQWKPWAQDQGEIFDAHNIKDEVVDVLHFVANLAVALGINGNELSTRYRAKQNKNADRQRGGYVNRNALPQPNGFEREGDDLEADG